MMKIARNEADELAFRKAVKVSFQVRRKNYNGILKVLKEFQDQSVKGLLKGHTDRITLPFQFETTGKKLKKVEENRDFPWDVLDIISKTLDFDDLFQFAGVCKNWRGDNNSFMLINPFTRINKVINTSNFEVQSYMFANHALLAFGKCSEEFVLVVLCQDSMSLHVYQSRNCGWVTYSTMENQGRVVDFVIFHNIIYVVTDKANIGVLSLNSANIKFLKLKSISDATTSLWLRLVNCDDQLLVVDMKFNFIRNAYKIDFSTMTYVELETLGDIALFCVSNMLEKSCYALRNPNMWGYESNSVYVISVLSTTCIMYSWDDKKSQKYITLPNPHDTGFSMFDWCFRHLRHEVDYSLV
ncbi:hypothetical protein MTR_1g109340 [Medicago truncatula]|uniref:Uncharacterized protein n=1 Tax=Medicago truncatula TaxID=3880 RepID=A0A072W1J8_MEDTR|nr:hypothetical protein MTR_1g109340 [Medicago truncatula]